MIKVIARARRAYLFHIAQEKSCDYLLIIFMKKLLDVFKVCKLQKRAEQFMEFFNLCKYKILGYYLRVFRCSREFLLPPLILAELCLGAYHRQGAAFVL